MNKQSCLDRVEEMLSDVMALIREETIRKLNSGAIDVDTYEDNYLLSKILLSIALEEASYQYRPLSDEGKKVFNNLKKF